MAALEFSIDALPGATVDSFALALRENAEPGSNVNQENATILACPITDVFWAHGQGARWSTRPNYDCNGETVAGERSKDGIWTFDLTKLAQDWTSEFPTSAPAVVLVEGADAPESFDVVFDGVAAEGIGLDVHTTPPPKTGPEKDSEDVAAGGTSASGPASPTDIGPSTGRGSTGSLSGLGSSAPASSAGAATLPEVGAASAPLAAPSGSGISPEVAAPSTQASTRMVSTAAPPWYAGIPSGGYLLLFLAVGLAYLAMLALGPDAQPTTAGAQHGVSRALARLQHMRNRVNTKGMDE